MSLRLNYQAVAPDIYKYLQGLGAHTQGLDSGLKHLIFTRASQLNGCAFCLDMHTRDARQAGETEQRLHTLAAWRETSFFSERERAALALTESLTLVANGGFDDDTYQEAARHFDEAQMAQLLLAIATINLWNRVAIGSGNQPVARS